MGKIELIESLKTQYEESGYIDVSLPIDEEEFQAIIDAFDFYIAEQKRAAGCAFCKMEIDDEHGFFMEQNYLFYREGKCGTEGIQVAYCPNCGRDLTEGESV